MLTQNRLQTLLSYDPLSGVFIWIEPTSNRVRVGAIAGTMMDGYSRISIDRRVYSSHRLSWLYMTGGWPKGEIDHINGDRGDNSWINLRDVSRFVNQQNLHRPSKNNKIGILGVCQFPNGRWRATIGTNGVQVHLGCFATAEEARLAYLDAKSKRHGYSGYC